MSPLASEFFALFVYGTAIVLLHELGHALFAPRRVQGHVVGPWTRRPPPVFFVRGGLVVYIGRICRWRVPCRAHWTTHRFPPLVLCGGLILQAILMCILPFGQSIIGWTARRI